MSFLCGNAIRSL